MRRTLMGVAVAAAVAAVGVACTGSSNGPGAGPSQPSAGSAVADPADLVGSWHLRAPGEPAGAILTIGDRVDGAILLFRPCGMLDGDWHANRLGMFVARIDGGDQTCFLPRSRHPHPLPSWPDRVVGFRSDGPDELLIDGRGHPVARLAPGAHPTAPPTALSEFAAPPVVTPQMRSGWTTPAPLPAGVMPATADDLAGRWLPLNRRPPTAYLAFDPAGEYSGSDGCNGAGGRYVVGPGGIVLATSGPSTAIGCENSPLPTWLPQSARLGLAHGQLVFVRGDGTVLGRAVRAR